MYRQLFTKLTIKNLRTWSSSSRNNVNVSHFDSTGCGSGDDAGGTLLTKTIEQNGIREIMLNDPKTRNSLSMAMMNELHHEIIKSNTELRVIVLKSQPDSKVFSAGHNLKEFATTDDDYQSKKVIFTKLTDIILAIHKSPVPVIAQVNGLATAAGCQLVASCDILVCSETSSFSLPGAEVGIFCSTPGVAVSRVMSRMKSSYLLFSGLPMSAQEAYIAGLVSRVVPNDKLDEEVEKICCSILRKSQTVLRLGKEFYYKQLGMNITDAFEAAENVMIKNLGTNDGREGVRSFVEKRKPIWTNS